MALLYRIASVCNSRFHSSLAGHARFAMVEGIAPAR